MDTHSYMHVYTERFTILSKDIHSVNILEKCIPGPFAHSLIRSRNFMCDVRHRKYVLVCVYSSFIYLYI